MHQTIEFATRHYILCGGFIAVIFMWLNFEIKHNLSGFKFISAQEVAHLVNQEGAKLLDLRSKDAFGKGHITGASCKTIKSAKEAQALGLDKNAPVVLVCENGQNASKAASLLKAEGYSRIHILKEGIVGWQNANFPLVN